MPSGNALLPITPFLSDISNTLKNHSSLVLQAEPGAGKSTALPLSLINATWLENKKIVMLEPRRVAVKSIAHYLAQQLNEPVGKRIGYQIKNERKLSCNTVLEIVTEGILTRRLQSDPELSDVGLIILDEFHERSIHSDLALMLALEVQQSLRDDLKILVMSATIDTQSISNYLGNAPIIECSGRAFPVEVIYNQTQETLSQRPLADKTLAALKTALSNDAKGDILVFLPGQADIQRCLITAQAHYQDEHNLLFLPLYGGLQLAQQEQALKPAPSGKRRVIFATNIAETSLTIEGINCVIDSGLEKKLIYDPQSGMTRLETAYISKASAEQRKGRAGRLQAGRCFRLWTESKQTTLKDFQEEEILNCDLTPLVLELHAWGLTDFHTINWLTSPPKAHFDSARQLLIDLGLLSESNLISSMGKDAATLGIHPRLASMLLNTSEPNEQQIACELAAVLSENDLFQAHASVDIIERLLALQDYKENPKQALKNWPIKGRTAEQILKASHSFRTSLSLPTNKTLFQLTDLQTVVSQLLLHAYPDRLAKKREENRGRYLLANGKGVQLFDSDPLFGSDWLVVIECNALKKEGQIFQASSVQPETIHQVLNMHFHDKNEYHVDSKKQTITGRKRKCYRAITLSTQIINEIPKEAFHQCLQELLLSEGLTILNWTPACEAWLARATWLGKITEEFPQLTHHTLVASSEQWLLPYLDQASNLQQLKHVDIYPLLTSAISWEQQQRLDKEAPVNYITPSGKEVQIRYDENQGPTVSVRLQEMFGELASPKLGCNKIPLRFELLSPAQRPIQTTSDLETFWHSSYHEIAKEMRGRYPKHRWPEQPLLEKPGHSIKHSSR